MEWRTFTAFLLVSVTGLFPYNLFMNAHEYFYYKFRNESAVNSTLEDSILLSDMLRRHGGTESDMEIKFEGYVSLFGGIACVLGAAMNMLTTKIFSNSFRCLLGHFVIIMSLIPTIAYTYINTDDKQVEFFYLTLFLASVASFGALGLLGGGILGLAATYPPVYMQAVMVGQAVAGVMSASLSIICQAVTRDAIINGRVYFILGIIWTVFSCGTYVYLAKKTPPAEEDEQYSRLAVDDDDNERLLNDEEIPAEPMEIITKNTYGAVIRRTHLDLFSTAMVLFVSLIVFPAVSARVKSTGNTGIWPKYFTSVCCFLVFNIGDSIGRLLASRVYMSRTMLMYACVARLIFVPLLVMCNVDPRPHSHTWLPYDGVFVLLMLLLAMSNGVCLTLSTINVTKRVDNDMREVAGSMVGLTCVTAALFGSLVGVLIMCYYV